MSIPSPFFRERTLRSRHDGVLGTTVELKIVGRQRQAKRAANTVMAQIERLERVFTAFDQTSDLCRYARGEPGPFAPEFRLVLDAATQWQKRSGGAFNPAAGALTARWDAGVAAGRRPDPIELRKIAAAIVEAGPDYRQHCNLNAIAKGYIVDASIDRAVQLRPAATEIVVSAGGDVAHRGAGSATVGIEDPLRPYDNVKPFVRIALSNAALATSGSAHRPFEIDGMRYSHVVDPRNGEPVNEIKSASVVADTAMAADVLATILVVIGPTAAAHSELFADTAWMVVDSSGYVTQNPLWTDIALPN